MKKTPKTPKQIKNEIDALQELKPKIPEHSMFGTNNHDNVEAEIRVLADDMSEDEIYDTWPVDGKDDEETQELHRENGAINSAAIYARQWLDGDEKESPSQGWASLAKKKGPKK